MRGSMHVIVKDAVVNGRLKSNSEKDMLSSFAHHRAHLEMQPPVLQFSPTGVVRILNDSIDLV